MCLALVLQGEYIISSQVTYWKRNELICQASLNLNGRTRQWGGKAGKRAWSAAGFSRAECLPSHALSWEQQSPVESSDGSEHDTFFFPHNFFFYVYF